MQQRPSYSSAFTIESIMAPQPRIPTPVLYGGYMFLPPVTDHATAHALTASSPSHHGVTSAAAAAAAAAAASLDPRTAAAVMGHAGFIGRPNPSSHHLLGVTGLAAAVAASSAGASPVVTSASGTVTGQSLSLAHMGSTNPVVANGPTISLSPGSLAPAASSPSLQSSESHPPTPNSDNHHYHHHHNRTSSTPTPPSSSSTSQTTSTNHSSSSSCLSLPNSSVPSSTVSGIVPLALSSPSSNHLSPAVITTVTATSPRVLARLGEYRVHHHSLNSIHHQSHSLYQQSSQHAEHDEQSQSPLSDYRHHSPDKGKTISDFHFV